MKTAASILAALLLILDSRCAAESVREAMAMCLQTLIPSLFPMLVLSNLLVPALSGRRIRALSRILGFPVGSESIFLLGCAGGFPVGAVCIAQAHRSGALKKSDAERMIGLSSFCGPGFLFGVVGSILGMDRAVGIFVIQLLSTLVLGALWPGEAGGGVAAGMDAVSLPQAVRRAVSAMVTVCAWVILAAVAVGFLERWLFPVLPEAVTVMLTGLLELTNGVFALDRAPEGLRFVLCTVFVCFGGVSVLLQIAAIADQAGLGMGTCAAQKCAQAAIGGLMALGVECFGWWSLGAWLAGSLFFQRNWQFTNGGSRAIMAGKRK